ncbi:MAG: 4-(cytidine 5'-diphospho)-2-C-methyl-D-erythritol kinase [Butyricicoccus sp.]
MRKEITLQAHAKINLTLDVTGKLPNGYHTVKMIMQTIGLHDDVTVTRGTGEGISLTCNLRFLPTDDSNLAVRAAKLFFEETGAPCDGVRIAMEKRIPVAAGLAGGSTNAAAVLRALNTLYETGLSVDELCEIGLKIGADVPYCIRGGSMLAEGIGEVLSPLPSMLDCHVVVCKPPFSVITAKVYARMNGGNLPVRPDTNGMIAALETGDYFGICHRLFNVMEEVTGGDYAEIGEIENTLLDAGADGAVMSGSGPTLFGLFSDADKAACAMERLKPQYPETFLTTIVREPNKI